MERRSARFHKSSWKFQPWLKMTTTQVVETSVTVTNSSFQNYTHPGDHTRQTTDTPGFKPFTKYLKRENSTLTSVFKTHLLVLLAKGYVP